MLQHNQPNHVFTSDLFQIAQIIHKMYNTLFVDINSNINSGRLQNNLVFAFFIAAI